MMEASANMNRNAGTYAIGAATAGTSLWLYSVYICRFLSLCENKLLVTITVSFKPGNAEPPVTMSPALAKNRKGSYGDVNKVSFHVPSSTPAVSGAASSAQHATTTSDSLSDTSSPPGSHNNSDNNIGMATISESLKYDLQSEDGESAMEKRQAAAAAAVALKAVQDRKNYGKNFCSLSICCEL